MNKTVINDFAFPTTFYPDNSTALFKCEKYCGKHENCWGCVKECDNICKWKAVTDYENSEESEELTERDVSQKPSMKRTDDS